MFKIHFVHLLVVVFLGLWSTVVGVAGDCNRTQMYNEHKILESILSNYDNRVPPSDVKIAILMELVELNVTPEKNKLKINAWIKYYWIDCRLKWNPSDFGGIYQVDVRDDQVMPWMPDMSVYNSIYPILECANSNYRINFDGTVEVAARSCNILVSCYDPPLTLRSRPNAVQTCSLILGSWAYSNDDLTLNCYSKIQIDPKNFRNITEYQVINTEQPIKSRQTFVGNHNYDECKYPIIFKRKDDY